MQSAVDAEHGLILHHEVTQEASDNRQLAPMADTAKAVLAQAQLTVVADAGYSNSEHLTHCAEAQVTAFVPPERAVNNQAEGTNAVQLALNGIFICIPSYCKHEERLLTSGSNAVELASCPLRTSPLSRS